MISKIRFVIGCALLGSIIGHLIDPTNVASAVGASIFGIAGMVSVIINE